MYVLSRALVVLTIAFPFPLIRAAEPANIIINEIAWMGTALSYNDEWLELYNNASVSLSLDGWTLKAADGSPEIKLQGTIAAKGFYLLERTDNNSVPNVEADQIYKGGLNNNGETLGLYDDNGRLADEADGKLGWPAGDNQTKQTMERTAAIAWQNSQNPGGTPRTVNSQTDSATEKVPSLFKPPEEKRIPKAELAAINEFIPQKISFSFLLIPLAIAILSGFAILFLKKKIS